MTINRKAQIQRLNILLHLPNVDVVTLDERGWNALLDKLYFAVHGQRGREFRQDTFHFAMTKSGIVQAQAVLRDRLPLLVRQMGRNDPSIQLELGKHWVLIATDPDGKYHRRYASADGPTLILLTLMECLFDRVMNCRDFRICANSECAAFHVPLRKPHAGKPSYCGKLCSGKIAARRFRKENKAKLRKTELKRNRKRYDEKLAKQLPGAKIRRRVRKG